MRTSSLKPFSAYRSNIVKSLVTVLVASWTLISTAATVYVGVGYFVLSPATVNIEAGDAVYWYEDEPDFGPYIISGAWGAFYAPGGVQFNAVGTYPYSAQSVFGGGSWGGTVIVSPSVPNLPPLVTITSPTNHSVFTAPATVAFAADAYDANPGVWDVEFWVNGGMVDDVFSPPYATTVANLPAGTYTLKAIAWDYAYATATNSVSITVVNPGPISLTGAALAAGNFRFDATGLVAGKTIVLQSSTNLASRLSWVPISTNVATGSAVSFTNAVAAGQRFFRLVQLP